jgi:hypothetical protein
MDLPMILGGLQSETVLSTPDSGSEENIISKDLIAALGLKIDDSPEQQKEFRMGNNKIVKALGGVTIPCRFARDQVAELECWFYVFNTLITPLIMGMKFLDSTETLTKNKHRLQARLRPTNGPLLCASINNPKRRLRCYTSWTGPKESLFSMSKFNETLANADTGSEIDLMSVEFCKRRGFSMGKVGLMDSKIQFADGSVAHLAGKARAVVTFGKSQNEHRIHRTFHVLEDLTCDVLFGEDFLEETNAFETYHSSFSIEHDDDLAQVNTIVWFKTPERFLARPRRNIISAPEPLSGQSARLI